MLIFAGVQVMPTTSPLPFYAYPVLVATLGGWIWTLVKADASAEHGEDDGVRSLARSDDRGCGYRLTGRFRAQIAQLGLRLRPRDRREGGVHFGPLVRATRPGHRDTASPGRGRLFRDTRHARAEAAARLWSE